MVNLQVGLLVREVNAKPLSHAVRPVLPRLLGRSVIKMSLMSHASDGIGESCWQWHCRGNLAVTRCQWQVMLAMTLARQLGRGVMSLPSHAGDDAIEANWLCRDVSAESYWQ
jgi:hypothetical protein